MHFGPHSASLKPALFEALDPAGKPYRRLHLRTTKRDLA
jgi:hypothetical protein